MLIRISLEVLHFLVGCPSLKGQFHGATDATALTLEAVSKPLACLQDKVVVVERQRLQGGHGPVALGCQQS